MHYQQNIAYKLISALLIVLHICVFSFRDAAAVYAESNAAPEPVEASKTEAAAIEQAPQAEEQRAPKEEGGQQQPAAAAAASESPILINTNGTSFNLNALQNLTPSLFTGAATYSVPIAVPAGRKGIQPNIALSYSSQSGNGMLGVGWSLDLGSIERSTKRGVPVYNNADAFLFKSGGSTVELVNVGGNQYRAKVEGAFMQFTFDGYSWTVKDKSGITYYFGQNASSQIVDSGRVFSWCLDKVIDANGNYMELAYSKDGNQIYPDTINYTGNETPGQALSPAFQVDFDYVNSRNDYFFSYRSNFRIQTNQLLSIITVKQNGQRIRKYSIGYQQSPSTKRYLLKSITQYGSDPNDTSSLPPITFSYQEKPFSFAPVTSWGNIHNFGDDKWAGIRATSGPYTYVDIFDLNRDGLVDRVLRGKTDPDYTRVWAQLNNGSSFDNLVPWSTIAASSGDNNRASLRYAYSHCYMNTFDIDGDALPDRVHANYNGNSQWEVEKNNGSGFESSSTWTNIDGFHDPSNYSLIWGFANSGAWGYIDLFDMNGDGKPDRVIRMDYENRWYVQLNNGNNGFDSRINWPTIQYDPNGGDWSELYIRTGGNSVYFTIFDINGDGLPDRLMDHNRWNNNTWNVQCNNGKGFENLSTWGSLEHIGSEWSFMFYGEPMCTDTVDINGDGLPDRVMRNYSNWQGNWEVQINNGHGFEPVVSWGPIEHNNDSKRAHIRADYDPTIVDFFDINGDGLPDRVMRGFSSYDHWDVQLNSGPFPDLLSQVENGIGGSATITYKPFVGYHNTEAADVKNLGFPVYVVTGIQTQDGRGESYATTLTYDKGKFDYTEREFRGFGKVRVMDAEGNYSIKYFLQGDYDKGRPYKEEAYDSGGNLFSKAENTWTAQEPYAGYPDSKLVYLSESNAYTFDGDASGRRTKTQYFYEEPTQYGNPTKAIEYGEVDLETGNDIGTDARTTYSEYTYNTIDWIVSLPKHAYTHDYYDNKVSEQWFYYDNNQNISDAPIKGLLSKEEAWLYNPKTSSESKVSSSYGYDVYGHLRSSTDANNHTTSTSSYDATYFIYPLTVTNALGHSVTTEYYGINGVPLDDGQGFKGLFGQVKSTTDPNQVTSYTTYDELGRVEKVIGPNDSIVYPGALYEYDLQVTSPIVDPVKVSKKIKAAASPSSFNFPDYYASYSFYDGLGRAIETKSDAEPDPGSGGLRQILSGVVEYNARGLVKKKYFPYFVDASPSFVTPNYAQPSSSFQYDCLGRVTQTTNPDSTSSSASYSDWVVTATDEKGQYKTYYYDAFGQLIQVDEHNNGETYATTYEYDTLGNLTKLTDSDNLRNITTITYDSLGRKLRMSDPDMGVWNYEYDNVGNLIKQIDAAGQQLVFQYDAINRLTQKTIQAAQTVTYQYDDPLKNFSKGRLTKVIYQAGSTEFFYDNLGREIQSKKIVDSSPFTVNRSYDSLDRLISLTYPDGETVNYTYNPQGIETVIGNTTYISNIDYAPTGQIVRQEYGNGTFTTYNYNPQTLRLEHMSTFDQQQATIQDFAYTFDSVGNIATITDSVNTGTQSFDYDDLNRLTYAQGASYGTINYSYDSIGNILTKGNLTLNYNDARPHAVSSYTDAQTGHTIQFTYDVNGNMQNRINQITGAQTDYFYDFESHLTRVEQRYEQGEPMQVTLEFQPGFNFFSLALVPDNPNVESALAGLTFGTDYDQVSRYDPATDTFDHYVSDSQFNHFDTLEYGKGYVIYITAAQPVSVTITGSAPAVQSIPLLSGWNLIAYPYLSTRSVQEALGNLVFGVDYDRVLSYNPSTGIFEAYPGDGPGSLSALEPGKSYYLRCLRDTNWQLDALSRTTEFYYDGDGGRVKRRSEIDTANTTVYIGALFEKVDYDDPAHATITKKHIFAGANRVCVVDNGALRFYHGDHLGSSNLVTDGAGIQLSLLEYSPFGEISRQSGSYSTDIKFTGKIQDDTGLYYYGARYYDPVIGRFVSPDTIVQAPQDPQTLNRYAYCRNNPLKYVDPTGRLWWVAALAIKAFIGAAIGSVIGGALAAIMGGNIGQGFATGAISGFGFGFVGGLGLAKGVATIIGHTLAGTVTGAINASVTGGNIGIGAAIGGFSGGLGEGVGQLKPVFTKGVQKYVEQAARRSFVGALAGGVASSALGGDFGEGAAAGAITASIAYVSNHVLSGIMESLVPAPAHSPGVGTDTDLNVDESKGGKQQYLHGTDDKGAGAIAKTGKLLPGSYVTKPLATDTAGKPAMFMNPDEYRNFTEMNGPGDVHKGEWFVDVWASDDSVVYQRNNQHGAPEYRVYGDHEIRPPRPNMNP